MSRVMPALEHMASNGMRFTRAVTPSPLCAPARACLATATAYGRSGVFNNQGMLADSANTYYRRLRDNGYAVLGAGKFDLHKGQDCWGTAGQCGLEAWGMTAGIDCEGKHDAVRTGADLASGPYMRYLHDKGLAQRYVNDIRDHAPYDAGRSSSLPDDAYLDNWIADHAERLLRDAPPDHPWHLVVNFAGPHEPLDPTQAMLDAVSTVDIDAILPSRLPPESAQLLPPYLAMLNNIDRRIARLLDIVQSRGEQDNTVVIYTSDHGEMLGEHGINGKAVFYEASIRIPLVIYDPRQTPTLDTYCEPVALQDVGPTILEWAGAEPMPQDDAVSLCPTLTGARAARTCAMSGLVVDAKEAESLSKAYFAHEMDKGREILTGDWRLAVDRRFKLVQWSDGRTRLFDLEADPDEAVNLMDDPTLPANAAAALAKLRSSLTATFGQSPVKEEE